MNSNDRVSRVARILAALLAGRTLLRTVVARATGRPLPRPAGSEVDIDPSERTVPADPSAEGLAATLMILAGIFGFGFVAVYIVTGLNTQLLGICLGGAFLLLAAAFIVIGKRVVPQETAVESRDRLLRPEETQEVVGMIESVGEGVSRRGLLVGAGGVAGAGLVAALAAPAASMGPKLDNIHKSLWYHGRRLVDDSGKPFKADEVEIGTFYSAFPEKAPDYEQLDASLLLVRLPADFIHLPPQRRDWAPQGIMAYSKICPHAGCAISLYRYPLYARTSGAPAFTCPCHYSTFLPGEGGRLLFGPAGRALPQLKLMIDAQGYVAAAQGFIEDVGPSWWNVHRGEGA